MADDNDLERFTITTEQRERWKAFTEEELATVSLGLAGVAATAMGVDLPAMTGDELTPKRQAEMLRVVLVLMAGIPEGFEPKELDTFTPGFVSKAIPALNTIIENETKREAE